MKMKPYKKSLGRNPLSDASYRNSGMVLNGQRPGRHPLGDALYLDLDTVLNKQGLGRRILCDALHRHPGVVKNEQWSSHLTRWMRRVRNLAEPSSLRVGNWNIGSLMGKLREIVDTIIRRRVNIPGDEMEGAKGKGGEKYRLQTLVHRHSDKQKWSRHCAR
jgi:hypothetical protein